VGGIVTHLVWNSVSINHVFFGPSESVFDSSICFQDRFSAYWDDQLTEEFDLICGVYRVDSG
jgi:hypothetical protein